MGPTRVAVAGSTGSIGAQTIEVVAASPERYVVTAISGGSSVDALCAQARALRPEVVVVADEAARRAVAERLSDLAATTVTAEAEALVECADVVVNGVVGFAGLPVTLGTLGAGKRLALANKESLIAAAPVVNPLRSVPGAEIIPVDSEHCAIHQCLRSGAPAEVARLVLTASGGPFRGRTAERLADVTVAEALAHPTWAMGPKITVDSSTLMNKGLEVIEASALFGVSVDTVEVVVHPQSVVHSMVEFTDGSTIAQLSLPDMRLPIAYALAWPERGAVAFGRIDWSTLSRLDFEPPDTGTFRCLGLAYEAGRVGGTAPAALSAANEVAVEAFLAGVVPWARIADIIEGAMNGFEVTEPTCTEDVLAADAAGREAARAILARFAR